MRPALTLDLPGLTLLLPVGSGSFGEVWLARTVTGQFRAVKIVWLRRSSEAGTEASLQELGDRVFRGVQEYVRRIPPGSSAGLAVLHVDRDPDGRFFYYVMELADDATTGREINPERYEPLTLGELRRRAPNGAVSADETIRLGVKLAEGLAALHHAGLVHRDIKPSNIVFIGGEPRLADIDLVRPREASLSLGGTLGYAPPESPGRSPADVFSLGRTLYVTVTGLPAGEFPRLPDDWDRLPGADGLQRLNSVLLRACDRDPAKRHQDGAALRDDLLLVAAGEDPERWRWLKRSARTAMIVAGIAVPVAIAALLVAWQLRQKEAAKTFALYQADLAETASNLERLSLGNARRSLSAAATSVHQGIEVEMLARQAAGDTCLSMPNLGAKADQLFFNSEAQLLAAATDANEFRVFHLASERLISVVTDGALLAGFLEPGRLLVGTSSAEDTKRPLCVWDAISGRKLAATLPGRWVPAGVMADQRTVVALARTNLAELVHWRPFPDDHAKTLTWHTSLPSSSDPPYPLVAVDALGRRLLYRQNLGRDDRYVSQLFFAEQAAPSPVALDLAARNVKAIALSADGQRAAYAEPSVGELVVGDFADGFHPTITNRQPEIGALVFSPAGDMLASGGVEQLVRVQDSKTLETRLVFSGHGNSITALAWSRDGEWIASGDGAGEVRVWHAGAAAVAHEQGVWSGFKVGVGPVQLVASADGSIIAATAGTNSVAVLDGTTLEERRRLEGINIPLCFAEGSNHLWALDRGGRLLLMDLGDGRLISAMNAFGGRHESAFGQASPDGRRLVLYAGKTIALWALDQPGPRRISSPSHLPETRIPAEPILDLAISDDSRQALTVGREGSATLWDLITGEAKQIPGLRDDIHAACFLPGTKTILLGTKAGRLLRVDTERPDHHEALPSDLTANYQLLATPDGARLFTAGTRGQLGVGRAPDGSRLVWFTHRGLAARPGEHALKRLLYLPRQRRLLSLTEDGLLARW